MPLGPVVWPPMELEIPATSPAAVAAPAFASWIERGRANRVALDASPVEIFGRRLAELRRTARGEMIALAASYTRALGIDVTEHSTDLVLCTGHQPVLVHPGIWVKYLALARLVPPDGVGLNLIVDSDTVDDVAAEVPRANGRLRRERVVLAQAAPDVPAEALPAPTADEWRAFLDAIDTRLRTLDEPEVVAGWARAQRLPPPPPAAGLPGAVTAARRTLEGPRPYLDLPVSWLVRIPAFRRFVLSIAHDAERFVRIHNARLAAYREHYGVRTSAQPFPDLSIEAGRVEVPFWYVVEGQRRPLFVDTRARRLYAADRDLGPLPEDPDDAVFATAPIRPRALTLTGFARLVLADLFIHGIGGGRYDRATDAIISAFFGIDPPTYAIATATLFLPFTGGGPRHAERQRLRRLLLDLQHNPDRFLNPDGGAHQALIDEKWSLIRKLEQAAGLIRRERRAVTQRIRELNTILRVGVAGRVVEVQEALSRLDRHQEDAEVTGYRGYPFLLFPVEAVDGLVDLLASGPTVMPGDEHRQ